MIMQLQVFVTLVGFLAIVKCRDNNKPLKPLPAIANSLVNFGKMDISFYINGKPDMTLKSEQSHNPLLPFMPQKRNVFEEPCPCSNLRNIKDSFLNPSEIINKILRSNDLFTNKNPAALCCDTFEHEDAVFFEITPNQKKMNPIRTNSFPSLLFDTLIPTRQVSPIQSKAVEILLYPKRKDLTTFQLPKIYPKKNIVAKDGIQIVGDKILKNDVKLINSSSTSVKKDLTGLAEKDDANEITQKLKGDIIKPNTL